MSNNNNENMYYKLKDELTNALISEEFYEVFDRSMKSGKNNFSLYQKYINNVIDPKWVEMIEQSIIPLDNIIRNPMRFIEEEEEIVNIEQTRKISQQSIRHLAQHTNMISKVERDGTVTPSKILNVHKEETFATYENRFIYTLLKHIQYFMDKRLRVLNESKVSAEKIISVESEFNIGKEKVKYQFSLSSTEKAEKNAKMFNLNEDTSQMSLVQRVERLRMILYDFSNSQLIKSLDGCLLVKPPIMRTNVILKNPNFKKAMELWTFIESYTDAGLSIQVLENEEIPNNEYISELSNIALMNYYFFNHHVKPEKQYENDLPVAREFKPSLVKRTVEEYLNDLSMDVDEIEKIFIEQVKKATKKRKDTENKIKKAIERALEKEKDLKKKALEIEKKRKEKERLLAKQAKEQERLLAKKALEEEKLRFKTNIENNMNCIIQIIESKFSELEIEYNKNKTAFKVFSAHNQFLQAQFNSKQGIIKFRGGNEFFEYVESMKPGLINKEIIDKQNDWYSVIDDGDLSMKDVRSFVNHCVKYVYYLEAEEERRMLAEIEKSKPVVFDKELVLKNINEIKECIINTYDDVEIVQTSDNTFRAYRDNKLVIIMQWTNTNYRLLFQRNKSAAMKLMKKYPGLVSKAKNPKGHQWYKLINTGDIKLKEVLSLINYSYKYLVEEEEKINKEIIKKNKTKYKKQKLERNKED